MPLQAEVQRGQGQLSRALHVGGDNCPRGAVRSSASSLCRLAGEQCGPSEPGQGGVGGQVHGVGEASGAGSEEGGAEEEDDGLQLLELQPGRGRLRDAFGTTATQSCGDHRGLEGGSGQPQGGTASQESLGHDQADEVSMSASQVLSRKLSLGQARKLEEDSFNIVPQIF